MFPIEIAVTALCPEKEKNCWTVDLFAVEKVAWGYSSTSVLSCLWKLRFCNKLARLTSKILGHTSRHVISTSG